MVRQIEEFEKIISGPLTEFIQLSNEIGGPVTEMGKLVRNAFEENWKIVRYGLYNAKLTNDRASDKVLEPLSMAIAAVTDMRRMSRDKDYYDNLSTVSESIHALSWIMVTPAPARFVHDMKESGEYYGIRVLRNHKGNQLYSKWVNSWYQVLSELEAYIRSFHVAGFSWGIEVKNKVPVPPAMPPPPPPPPSGESGGHAQKSDKDDRAALLQELNAGTEITKRLKKVDLSSSHGKTAKPSGETFVPAQKVIAKRFYPPKFALEGKKWCIEHQKKNIDIEIHEAEMSQAVCVYKCEYCVVVVHKKINCITIDSCRKCTIVVSDIISSVEIIHCDDVEILCQGKVPLVQVDVSDGVQVFTTDESSEVEVISTKSSALNICVKKPNGDFKEMPVPEQIRTTIAQSKTKLLSSVVEKV